MKKLLIKNKLLKTFEVLGLVGYTFNPSTQEVDPDRSLTLRPV